MRPLLNEFDVAALLDTEPAKVRRLVKSDGLPVIDLPGVGPRFDAAAVDSWVRGRQKATNNEGGRDARGA